MVAPIATVSSNSLGFSSNSLGQAGVIGNTRQGQQQVAVNIATGNLIVQNRDDLLKSVGEDSSALRTYNSRGQLDDDNGDNWSNGFYRQALQLFGALNSANSYFVRTERDGAQSRYDFNAASQSYISTDGDGAYDSITYDAAQQHYLWQDGASRASAEYALDGRLQASIASNGQRSSYRYQAGLISEIADASGGVMRFEYQGNLLQAVHTSAVQDGQSVLQTRVRYHYDAQNRLDQVVLDLSPADNDVSDGNVYITNYSYDGDSTRLANISQSDGSSLSIGYQLVGGQYRVASITNALNQRIGYEYDLVNNSTSVTDAMQQVTRYQYDGQGQLIAATQSLSAGRSQSLKYQYDEVNGDVLRIEEGEGRFTNFAYDERGNQVYQSDAQNNYVSREFSSRNELLSETREAEDGTLLTTRHVYNARGQLRFSISAQGRVSELRYNALGQLSSSLQYPQGAPVSTTNHLSEAQMQQWALANTSAQIQRTDYEYDGLGQLRQSTQYAKLDANGEGLPVDANITKYFYDRAGQLLITVDAKGGNSVFAYDGLGRVLASTNANHETSITRYDDAGMRSIVTLANGLQTTSQYDRAGQLLVQSQRDASNKLLSETRNVYDANHQLRMTQDATGVQQWFLYDTAGRQVASVDAQGILTENRFDSRNQVIHRVRYSTPLSAASMAQLQLDPASAVFGGNIIAQASQPDTDQRSRQIFDLAGRLAKTIDALGYVTTYRYDAAGRMIETLRSAKALSIAQLKAIDTAQANGKPLAASDKNTTPAIDADNDRRSRQFYDKDGLLVAKLDAEGYLTQFVYNQAGQLAISHRYATPSALAARLNGSLEDLIPDYAAQDVRSVTLYNNQGQIAAQIDAENYLTRFWYDANGQETMRQRYSQRVQGTVQVNASTDDAMLQLATRPQDQITRNTYDALNRLQFSTNTEGTQTHYMYDEVGNLLSARQEQVSAADGGVRGIEKHYDLQGRVVAELGGEGSRLLQSGNLNQSEVDAIWAKYGQRYTYDAAGRRTSSTDALQHSTLYYYDTAGRLQYTINSMGEVQQQSYNADNQVASTTWFGTRLDSVQLARAVTQTLSGSPRTALQITQDSKLDSVTSFAYDKRGLLTQKTDALSKLTKMSYNAFGELETETLPTAGTGSVRTLRYDKLGQVIQSKNRVSASSSIINNMQYDGFGRLIQSQDGNGNITRRQYDKLGRVVQIITPLESEAAQQFANLTTYDAFDRVLTQSDALGNITSYLYDTQARRVTIITPEGVRMSTQSNRYGQRTSVSDGNGNLTQYEYDANGQLIRTEDASGAQIQVYDAAGLLRESVDGRGIVTRLEYDAANRVLRKIIDPSRAAQDGQPAYQGLNLSTSYIYDAKGQVIYETDANGIVSETQYDKRGQVTRRIVDSLGLKLTTSLSYDAAGNVLTVTSPNGLLTTSYTYDGMGRRLSQTESDKSGYLAKTSFVYDNNGNLSERIDANGNRSRQLFDAENRLQYSVDAEGGVQYYEYDAEGRTT